MMIGMHLWFYMEQVFCFIFSKKTEMFFLKKKHTNLPFEIFLYFPLFPIYLYYKYINNYRHFGLYCFGIVVYVDESWQICYSHWIVDTFVTRTKRCSMMEYWIFICIFLNHSCKLFLVYYYYYYYYEKIDNLGGALLIGNCLLFFRLFS